MSIKDIISKAKETPQSTNNPSNQDTNNPSNQDTSNQIKKNKSKKDLARKGMNLDVPAVVKNYWMGKIKGEGGSFKDIVIKTLIKKYGLPDNWTAEDL